MQIHTKSSANTLQLLLELILIRCDENKCKQASAFWLTSFRIKNHIVFTFIFTDNFIVFKSTAPLWGPKNSPDEPLFILGYDCSRHKC